MRQQILILAVIQLSIFQIAIVIQLPFVLCITKQVRLPIAKLRVTPLASPQSVTADASGQFAYITNQVANECQFVHNQH